MGMFDTIRFENDISDPHLREEEWQTKSLDNFMLDYRVSADGKLFVTRKEYRTKETPDKLFGWALEVVNEWEEQVNYHGVVEAYCYQHGEEQTQAVIYDLYFTYGRLTSTQRREESYVHAPPRPNVQDSSPVVETTVGGLSLQLPASLEIRRASQEGEVWVVHVAFDGDVFTAHKHDGRVELRGRTFSTGDAPLVETDGTIAHVEGLAVTVLAESRHPDSSLVLVLAPEQFLGGKR